MKHFLFVICTISILIFLIIGISGLDNNVVGSTFQGLCEGFTLGCMILGIYITTKNKKKIALEKKKLKVR